MPSKRTPRAKTSKATAAAKGSLDEYRRKRDFAKTNEPAGGHAPAAGALRYVIQKHAATALHFDLRLELDSVMKSWAVPKGPSLDPAVKRLAMQVEDHPIEYNTFEGTIPEGEYGGGTVMLWDRGTYGPASDAATAANAGHHANESILRQAYDKGDFKFELYGERLRGSWVLVRTRYGSSSKEQWLLIKHRDEYAVRGSDIVAEEMTSVATGRTMEEIEAGGAAGHPHHAPPKQVSARPAARPRVASSRKRAPVKRAARTADPDPTDDGLPELPFETTHLAKVMFPRDGYTKGDLFRYYVRVAPQILPVMRDRALALKRYPGGIGAPFFFQQNAPAAGNRPRGVRVEPVKVATEGGSLRPRIVGGTLATLLYTVQLGCIEVDPWLVRLQSLDSPDYSVIDLDPAPDLPFERIVEVANWVREALDALGLNGVPKTTGSRGIHIFIPLPLRTSNETSFKLARLIANRVVVAHPRATTVERDLDSRPPRSVYIDFVQNARGKTVAAAYCVRPVDGARVSMPLAWTDLTSNLDHRQFTIATAGSRIDQVGDLWAEGLARRNSAAAIRDALRRA